MMPQVSQVLLASPYHVAHVVIQVTFDGRFVEPIFQLRIGIRFDQGLHQGLGVQLHSLVQGQGATWRRVEISLGHGFHVV